MQIGDGTHRFVHPVHQSLQRLIWTLPDRKQSVIGIETRTRTLCKVHRLEFCPDSNGVRLNSPKMDPLLMLNSKKERTSSLLTPQPPILQLCHLSCPWLLLLTRNQHPKTPHHQPCLHLHGPLRVVGVREGGDRGRGGIRVSWHDERVVGDRTSEKVYKSDG